jgi:hypothetical protein
MKTMSKSTGIHAIKSAASAGAHELARKGMHKAARGLRVVGGATASIGRHVEGWDGELGGMMRGAPIGRRKKRRGGKRKASSSTKRKRKGSRKRRSPAQMRAFRKMIAANPNRKRRRKGAKRRKGGRRRKR